MQTRGEAMKPGDVVLLVGARGNVGSVFVKQFVDRGANVILFSRNREALEKLSKKFPASQILVVVGDATNSLDIERATKLGKKRFGKVDGVVITAGGWKRVSYRTPMLRARALADRHIQEHFLIPFEVGLVSARFFARGKRGIIINISSHAGLRPELKGNLTYGSMKAAAHHFMLALRHELEGTCVRVVDIAPATINTRNNAKHLNTRKKRQGVVQPEDIGKWIMWAFNRKKLPPTKRFRSKFDLK